MVAARFPVRILRRWTARRGGWAARPWAPRGIRSNVGVGQSEVLKGRIDRPDDPARVLHTTEREVIGGAAGRVEVDRAHAEEPLEQPLARVDVLDPFQP